MYGNDLDFSTTCSDGRAVELKDDDGQLSVDYEARMEYCQCVRKARMLEFIDQVYTYSYFHIILITFCPLILPNNS